MHFYAPLLTFLRVAWFALLLMTPVLLSAQQGEDRPEKEVAGSGQEEEGEGRRVRRLGDVASDEWEMDLSMPAAAPEGEPLSEYDLPDPEQNAQLQNLLSTLVTRPGNTAALKALDEFLDGVLSQAQDLAAEGKLEEMKHLLGVIRNVNPRKQGLSETEQLLEDLENISAWMREADLALDAGRVVEPEDNCAMLYLDQVLAVDPENQEADSKLLRVQRILVDRALAAAQELDFDLAEEWLYEASLVRGSQEPVEAAEVQIAAQQAGQIKEIEAVIQRAIDEKNFDLAEFTLIDLIALVGNDERVQSLRNQLDTERRYGQYTPGQVITDPFREMEGTAPAVVVVKSGSFLMGSPEDENDHKDNEGPQHRVTLERGFAIGQYEVTVGQFGQFVRATRYRSQADTVGNSRVYDEGSGRITKRDRINWAHDYEGKPADNTDPVVHVDWYDAQAYVQWLSAQTGQNYRLPSEAEFEYSIRAGSVTRYWWGDDRPQELVENLTGAEDESSSGRSWSSGFRRYDDGYWGPAPVGMFRANSFGLYDMAGNVSEWIEDCWHQTYSQAPADGSAWVNPGCERRVVRGGYWASAPDNARSAARISAGMNLHGPRVGFRVARDL